MPTPSHEQALARIARAMIGELDLRQIAEVVIDQCVHSLTADAAVLWIADSTLREIRLLADRGIAPETADEIKMIPFDAPLLAALVARTCRVQVIDNIRRAPPKPPIRTIRAFAGMQAILVVPLTVQQRLVGVISHGFRTPRQFSADDLSFNVTAADMFAVTILNAQLYDQARQRIQLHEEFMAAAAHELRTPLTVIKGGTQRALRSGAHDTTTRSTFEAILRQTDRIDHLVDDLLTIQQVRPGQATLHCSRFDLSILVRTSVDETTRANAEHNVRLQIQATSEVDADRGLIATAIRHLLAYAICYTATGEPIEVGVDREDEHAVVSVTRHGPPIPPERQRHLFEPFYESIPSGAPGYAGIASVGLYLSKLIAEAHGGRIGLTVSQGDRETVWFCLPLPKPAGE